MKKNLAKLVKKVITDKRGKKTTVWVKMGEAKDQPKNKKEMETAEDGTHSVEHNGSKYYSMPDESKEDFAKRATEAIKQDHKVDIEINHGSSSKSKESKNEGAKQKLPKAGIMDWKSTERQYGKDIPSKEVFSKKKQEIESKFPGVSVERKQMWNTTSGKDKMFYIYLVSTKKKRDASTHHLSTANFKDLEKFGK